MKITKALSKGLFAGLCFASGIAVTVALAETSFPPVEVLVSSSQTILGQTFDYPAGQATVTAAIVTLQPGQSTGSHMHEAPLFVMVLEGEVTVDYGQGVTKRYVKDDAFLEAYKSNHNGTNSGSVPVRILTVYAGSDSVKNTVMEE